MVADIMNIIVIDIIISIINIIGNIDIKSIGIVFYGIIDILVEFFFWIS